MSTNLNPLDCSEGLVLSNGNLSVSNNAIGSHMVRANISKSAGKWYWEVRVDAYTTRDFNIGIATDASGLDTELGQDAYGWCYLNSNGYKYNNASWAAYGLTFTTDDVIGVALDADNNILTFYKNNSSQGEAFTGLTGTYLPAVSLNNIGQSTLLTFNFGASAFAYTPPSGYSGFDAIVVGIPIFLLNQRFRRS